MSEDIREQERKLVLTYSLGFFLGPGLPLALGSAPLAPGALLFTPFFLGPSVGGPIGVCDGVSAWAGVPGLDVDAFSPFVAGSAGTTGSAGVLDDGAGDAFAGDSSLTDVGSSSFRSLSGETLRVTIDVLLPVEDLRRSLSLVVVVVLVVPAILSVVIRREGIGSWCKDYCIDKVDGW
jgi:hypothetical protein